MPMNARRRSLAVLMLLAVLLLLSAAWAWWPRAHELELAVVSAGPFRIDRVDQGVTRVRELYVLSAPVAGRVERIGLEPGDRVVAGQVLARLRTGPAVPLDARRQAETQAAAQAARARLEGAQVRARLANEDYARARHLTGAIPDAELSAARSRQRDAQAQLSAARAEWLQAKAAASWTAPEGRGVLEVRAPVDGMVLQRHVGSEAVVAAGAPLVELGDVTQLEVEAAFLSEEAARMAPGAPASIEAWGGAPVPARVLRVEPAGVLKVSALGVEEQRVRVILALDQVPAGLGHGYRVDARITVYAKNKALSLPVAALVRSGEFWQVWRVKNGCLQRVSVRVGDSDGQRREVLSGLDAGEKVVSAPDGGLEEGACVREASG